MGRQPRRELGDGIFHVTARGVARCRIFHDCGDFTLFVCLLRNAAVRFAWALHVWCLLPNHYHLLVEAPQPRLFKGMHRLNGRYAQCFNHRYGRAGHLFQNRFGARLIDAPDIWTRSASTLWTTRAVPPWSSGPSCGPGAVSASSLART